MSIISGEAYWAHVITPNTKFNPDGEWSIEVCNLNAKNKKVAEADGLTIKNKVMIVEILSLLSNMLVLKMVLPVPLQ